MAGTIEVKLYGLLRRRVRTTEVRIAVGDGGAGEDRGPTVLELLRLAEEAAGGEFLDELLDRERGLLDGTIILVNGENIRLKHGLGTRVAAGDLVDLFSPAGGG